MTDTRRYNWTQVFIWTFCSSIFAYVFIRAWTVPFTFDEVTTSQLVLGSQWNDFGLTANNHLLNVLLIKSFLTLFSPSEFIFRLPNVLAGGLYLIYAYKMGQLLMKDRPWIPLVLLTSMPFLLDFFSLARGYGLAISFSLVSIYYLIEFAHQQRIKTGLFASLFILLAVLSNLTALNAMLPVLGVLLLFSLKDRSKRWLLIGLFTLISAAFLYFIIPIAFDLKNAGELFFGGRRGFYHDTLLSLSRTFAYHKFPIALVDVVFALLFILACAKTVVQLTRALRDKSMRPSLAMPILFILCVISPMLQHSLLETSFPTERTALIFYPILILVLVNRSVFNWHLLREAGLSILAGIFLLQLVYTLNFTHYYSWKFDAGSRDIFATVQAASPNQKQIRIGVDYIFAQSVRHYAHPPGNHTFEIVEVTKCWEYNLGLEELNPKYYGAESPLKVEMSNEDYETFMSYGLDYYYLNDFVIELLEQRGATIRVIKEYPVATAKLIQLLSQ